MPIFSESVFSDHEVLCPSESSRSFRDILFAELREKADTNTISVSTYQIRKA